MATTRWQKMAIGATLIALLWIILAAVAFIPFGRDSSALAIIATGLVVFAAIVAVLVVRRRVDLELFWRIAESFTARRANTCCNRCASS